LATDRPGVEDIRGFRYVEIIAGQWTDVDAVPFARGLEPSITR
jgi:hypothetical protein